MVRIPPQKRFGSDKFCSVNDFAVPNLIRAKKVVRARVKLVRVTEILTRLG